MEWDKAERLEAPLLDDTTSSSSGDPRGGGDVSQMLRELAALVRQLKRRPDQSNLQAAWVVAESIQACLRPPNPATLTSAQRRELRSCLLALQQLGDDDGPAAGAGTIGTSDETKSSLEIEAAPPRRQLVLQEEEDKSYDDELEAMRQRDIDNITTRVSTVNQIFSDIAGLISTQQDEVDSIEAAVSNAHSRTNKGQQQLIRAEKRRTAKLKCCFYFAVILACFAVILILAIIGFKNLAKGAPI